MSNLQHTASIFKLFFIFCFLIGSSSADIDDVSVNCGSSGASAAGSGKEWRGDIQPNSPPSLQMKGATVIRHSISGSGVPYNTARLSRSQFTYTLKTVPGQKILRLHFNPTSYRGFKSFNDLFDVEAGGFSLLGNFSASLAADALGLTYVVKEFCINIDEDQVFDIVFSPISSQLVDTYAFINGIEIISVPASLSYFHGRYVGVEMAGKSNVDTSSAIEVVRRVNLKQDSVSSDSDMDSMLGMWETISRWKESKIKSVKWRTSVGVGFRYLVRLHFSEIGLKMAEMSGVTFKLCINDVVVDTNIGISREGDYEDIVHWYRDYMVAKMVSLAMSCVQYEADFRPKMSIVVKVLQHLLKTASKPPTQASNSTSERRSYLEQWMSHCRVPEELRRKVRVAHNLNWAATSMFDEEMLMGTLPQDLQFELRRHLFEFVKKFQIFNLCDQHVIRDAICERLRTKTYIEGSRILYPDRRVDNIVFIIQGKVRETICLDEYREAILSEGDIVGGTLLSWCIEDSSVRKGPILLSDSEVRCLTHVEALVLRAADLEEVVSLFARFIRIEPLRWAARYRSPYWRRVAARRIQAAWRHTKRRLEEERWEVVKNLIPSTISKEALLASVLPPQDPTRHSYSKVLDTSPPNMRLGRSASEGHNPQGLRKEFVDAAQV